MKNRVLLFVFFLVFVGTSDICFSQTKENSSEEETIAIYCSPDLTKLTTLWVEEFSKQNQEKHFVIESIQSYSLIGGLSEPSISFVSENFVPKVSSENTRQVLIARDIVVPIFNSENPLSSDIEQQGISPQKLALALSNNKNWNELLQKSESLPFTYYTYSDASINMRITDFLNMSTEKLNASNLLNVNELFAKIQQDKNSIGFCRLTDLENNLAFKNIKILPIDKNGNGKLDYVEQIYTDINTFKRGVWIGKYSTNLVTNIYSVDKVENINKTQEAFLLWILTDGQNNLNSNGYTELVSSEIQGKLDKITEKTLLADTAPQKYANLKSILIWIGILLLIGLLIDFVAFQWNRKAAKRIKNYEQQNIFSENELQLPAGFYFDKTHTWAFMEKNGEVKIGLNDFFPSITGQLTGVKLKSQHETVTKGEVLLSIIQEGKQLDIKAPVSGTIKELNTNLLHNASLLNFSPYDEGWAYKIEPNNWLRETEFLLRADTFKSWFNLEYLRFKDFLAIVKIPDETLQPLMVLQEGGEIKKSVLKDFEPEVWEDFQLHFIDSIS